MRDGRQRPPSSLRRVYRLGLRAYRWEYRRDMGRDMEETFRDRYRGALDSGRWFAATRFTLRAFWDVLVNAALERVDHHRRGRYVIAAVSGSHHKGDGMFNRVWQDLQFGARTLRKSPTFTGIAVLTLSLGVGANTAIFSVVNGVLLQSLPYEDPGSLTAVKVNSGIAGGPDWYDTSEPEFHDFDNQIDSFQEVAAYSGTTVTLGDSGTTRRVRITRATADLLPMLGVNPILGRTFTADEDRPNGQRTLVLSYGMWQRDFGGDPGVIGQTVNVFDQPVPIVGVMPAGFEFPDARTEAWAPLGLDLEDPFARNNHYLPVLARLRPGASLEAAQTEVDLLAARSTADFPEFYPEIGYRIRLQSYHDLVVGDVSTPLYILLGAVAFVLLTACVNVANLLLARGEVRKREMAIRTALGASGRRVMQQLITENFLIAAAGGLGGILVAFVGVEALLAAAPDRLPRLNYVGVDAAVLGFSVAVAIGTGFAFGLLPAFQAAKTDMHGALKDGGNRGGTRSGHTLRRALVVVQMGLAVVLVVGSGLMLRSILNMYKVDMGFTTENVLTFRVNPSPSRYNTAESRIAFYERFIEQASALPGVTAVGAVGSLPLSGGTSNWSIVLEGQPVPTVADAPAARVQQSTPEYFGALGLTLVHGRLYDVTDVANAPGVVVINEAMAQAHWPDQDPIGKRMRVFAGDPPWMEVIGVVRNVRYRSVSRPPEPRWYVPHAQSFQTAYTSPRDMTIVVRTSTDPNALTGSLRNAMTAIDPGVPISQVQTMEGVFAEAVAGERFVTMLLLLFGTLALFLAAVGVYGVISYAVSQRTHEIGLRMALGASGGTVLHQVVREGLVVAMIGVGVGLGGSIALSRAFETLVFGITATDPLTYALVIAVLTAAAAGASVIPARRASRVSPAVALREQ